MAEVWALLSALLFPSVLRCYCQWRHVFIHVVSIMYKKNWTKKRPYNDHHNYTHYDKMSSQAIGWKLYIAHQCNERMILRIRWHYDISIFRSKAGFGNEKGGQLPPQPHIISYHHKLARAPLNRCSAAAAAAAGIYVLHEKSVRKRWRYVASIRQVTDQIDLLFR